MLQPAYLASELIAGLKPCLRRELPASGYPDRGVSQAPITSGRAPRGYDKQRDRAASGGEAIFATLSPGDSVLCPAGWTVSP